MDTGIFLWYPVSFILTFMGENVNRNIMKNRKKHEYQVAFFLWIYYTNYIAENNAAEVTDMIYLLEDESGIRNFVLYALNNSGFEAEGFETPSAFYKAMEERLPDLLLLDIMLPEEDGVTILKKLRSESKTRKMPIILLTAKSTEFDKVTGLDSGADDYITKPFGTMELISRIKALLRRTYDTDTAETLTAGGITAVPSRHEVSCNGERVALTLKEYELLITLLRDRGEVFSREQLLRRIWGYDFTGESRTVDVHIRTLRSKLGDCGDVIETVRGVGYRIGGGAVD